MGVLELLKSLLIVILLQLASSEVDKTVENNAVGEEVVDAVIAKIGSLFGKDYEFFKRLAYVDTRFGESPVGELTQGLWYNTEAMFRSTTETKNHNSIYEKIYQLFGIKWRLEVGWDDLRKPLYSALALHLYLYIKDPSTVQKGFPQTIGDQAKYRRHHLMQEYKNNRIPNEHNFALLVKQFEETKKDCNAKLDLIVVLDGSGSVTLGNFNKSLDFVSNLFARYSLDTTRLGFIIYSNKVYEYLSLDSGKNAQQIDEIIRTADFPGRKTNTNGGIVGALNFFRQATPRPGVPKVLAVFTDGVSTRGSGFGNGVVPAIRTARAEGIITYAVGIGFLTDPAELLEIAQGQSGRVFSLNDFNVLLEFSRHFHLQTCAESQRPSFGQVSGDALNYMEHKLYRFQWGKAIRSFRITLKTTEGLIESYYGSNRGVNRAWYDGQILEGENYVDHPDLSKQHDNNVRRRRDDEDDREFNIDHIYDQDTDILTDEFYNTEDPGTGPTQTERYLFIYILGLDSVNKYTIVVEEVDFRPTTTTTTKTIASPTAPITPTTAMATPISIKPSMSEMSTSNVIGYEEDITTSAPSSFLDSAVGLVRNSISAGNSLFGKPNVFPILVISLVLRLFI